MDHKLLTTLFLQLAFFKVNYDETLWYRIIAVLKSDKLKEIDVSCRAQLVGDVFAFGGTGLVSFNVTYGLAEYIVNETEYEPWWMLRVRIERNLLTLEAQNKTEEAKALKVSSYSIINKSYEYILLIYIGAFQS